MHLLSGPRLPFTATYFGAIVLTIYFAVGVSVGCAPGRPGLTAVTAALHTPHVIIVDYPACCLGMVSCQLLPDGEHGSAIRGSSRWWKSGSVDERLNGSTACTDIMIHLASRSCRVYALQCESSLSTKLYANSITTRFDFCTSIVVCIETLSPLQSCSINSPPLAVLLLLILTHTQDSICY